ncbi:MAG: 2TM domain-containing protein [Formosimonas sp.]|jgi:transcriptional regulator with XRE-family HTH domain
MQIQIQKLRLKKGWSQEQLAELCDLSVRTIQRIEKGQTPSLESSRALAAVFEIDIDQLGEDAMQTSSQTIPSLDALQAREEAMAFKQVRKIKGFYAHLAQYVVIIPLLFAINAYTSPDYWWAVWPMLGWGFGLLIHAARIFGNKSLWGANWERRQAERILGRKL